MKTNIQASATILFVIIILLSVFQGFLVGTVSAEQNANRVPVYVFEGAYATYTLNDYYTRKASFAISEVDQTAQTFKVTWTYIGDWGANVKGTSHVFSYAKISPFLTSESPFPFSAVTVNDLEILNRGEVPTDFPAGTIVAANISVFVRGGAYFDIDELRDTNGNVLCIDRRSGLAVIEDLAAVGDNWGMKNGELNLIYTNIPMTPIGDTFNSPTPSPSPLATEVPAFVAVAAIAVAAVAAGLWLRFKRHKPV